MDSDQQRLENVVSAKDAVLSGFLIKNQNRDPERDFPSQYRILL